MDGTDHEKPVQRDHIRTKKPGNKAPVEFKVPGGRQSLLNYERFDV